MSRRDGPSLAERVAGPAPPSVPETGRPRPVVHRHCWVSGLQDAAGAWPGLLVEWRRAGTGWEGRVVYAVLEEPGAVLVECWVPAERLSPA